MITSNIVDSPSDLNLSQSKDIMSKMYAISHGDIKNKIHPFMQEKILVA